jgi:hypothetical protein
VFAVISTAGLFYGWLKSPDWIGFVFILGAVATLAFVILSVLEVPLVSASNLEMVFSSPWFFMLLGAAQVAFIIYVWMNRDSPNFEIETPLPMEELKGPMVVIGLVISGVVALFGFLGLFDSTFVRHAEATLSTVATVQKMVEMIGAFFIFCISVWCIFQRYLISGIVFALLSGAIIVAAIVDIF